MDLAPRFGFELQQDKNFVMVGSNINHCKVRYHYKLMVRSGLWGLGKHQIAYGDKETPHDWYLTDESFLDPVHRMLNEVEQRNNCTIQLTILRENTDE
jgi:hypothetical protein